MVCRLVEDIRLLGEESLFDEEVVGHIGVVFAIDIDAGVKFLDRKSVV